MAPVSVILIVPRQDRCPNLILPGIPNIGDIITLDRQSDPPPKPYRVSRLEWELFKEPPEREVVYREVGWRFSSLRVILEEIPGFRYPQPEIRVKSQ